MKCLGKTKDDQPCLSHALGGSDYCYFHDPAAAKERRQAQSKGGSNRLRLEAIPAPASDFDVKDPGKIADLLNYVANQLVRGQMEPKVAYAVGYIAQLALRVNGARELAEQVAPANRAGRDHHPEGFGFEEPGIELSDLPEEARKVLAELSEKELTSRYDEVRDLDGKDTPTGASHFEGTGAENQRRGA
jgi:hypothetical protein